MKKLNLSSRLTIGIFALSLAGLLILFVVINTYVRGMIVSHVHDGFEQGNVLMSRDVDDWINYFKPLLDAKAVMAAGLPRELLDDMAYGLWEQNADIAISFFSYTEGKQRPLLFTVTCPKNGICFRALGTKRQ